MTVDVKGMRIRRTQKLSPDKIPSIWEDGTAFVKGENKWENSEVMPLTNWVAFQELLNFSGPPFFSPIQMIGFGFFDVSVPFTF